MHQKLNLNSFFNNKTGYSIAAVNITRELLDLGVDLTIFPEGPLTNEPEILEWLNPIMWNTKQPSFDCTALKIYHENNSYTRPPHSNFFFWPIFELDNFPPNTIHSLKSADNIIVCSEWAKSVLVNLGLTQEKIYVVPLGVNTKVFRPIPKNESSSYIFIYIGKASINKGTDVVIKAFNRAFAQKDNVELWLLANNPFDNMEKWLKLGYGGPLGHKIKFWPQLPNQQAIADLINSADCGIFPSRAEGFNLPLLETMACGKPVIATNYSGHTAFLTQYNSFSVSISETEPANDGIFFHGIGHWGKIEKREVDEFAQYMKFCYENRPSNQGGVETAQKLTWKNCAAALSNTIFAS